MATSYSAIKIPVPGNIIDTPGASDGHLLHFQDGVYTNFVPLIVDLRPDTGFNSLTFNVSVATGDLSYDGLTETGMFLSRDADDGTFSLNIGGGAVEGNATLDVGGDARFKRGFEFGSNDPKVIFPDGVTRPASNSRRKYLNLDPAGNVLFQTLENSATSSDSTINISDNNLMVDVNYLWQSLYYPEPDSAAGGHINITESQGNAYGAYIGVDILTLRKQSGTGAGKLFSGDADGGIFVLDTGVISIDTTWCGTAGNLFNAGNYIDITSGTPGTISVDLVLAATVLAGTGLTGDGAVLNTSFKWVEAGPTGEYFDWVGLADTGSIVPTHMRIEGRGRFNILGGHDEAISTPKHYSASFGPSLPASDAGGIQVLTGDTNNDEFAIKCENLVNGVSWGWDSVGHNTDTIPLTESHHPLYYVKASSGVMYNSSHYYTEGRIMVGVETHLEDAEFRGWDNIREGAAITPNPPAHINIVSDSPTMLMHQTFDATAPQILMTSANEGNIKAWGPISITGSHSAATWLSNRDGSIFNIETSTSHMNRAVINHHSDSTTEMRFNTVDRAHVWSLDYYHNGVTGDNPDYCYMRMGASDFDSTGAGVTYLPISNNGLPPAGMKKGGFWLDNNAPNWNTSDNPVVRVYIAD